MQIDLANAGKRFRFDWIFRDLNYRFAAGERYALLGPNGSGKSTLMKVLSGHLSLSKGQLRYESNGRLHEPDAVYRQIGFAAPYIELIEEFTLEEALRFHARLRPLLPDFTADNLYALLDLPRARNKELRFFSSGMKQRVKLALAVCTDAPVLLLDEPSTNLDVQAVRWFKQLVETYAAGRLLVIASNDPGDLELCRTPLDIRDYK
ncbi:MAG: ABC transporter ATP-binding protein [Saprospirales bacterium]|nr:ABC transporter ATP-binding protein [Saprospirales bacterium]MBK8924177.1 ABC transporter ATP-binding protein [Saprospirales bacterium]